MLTEQQKQWQKHKREEKKVLEEILHPNPIINGVEICHEHLRNGYISFMGWNIAKDSPVDNGLMQFIISREDILSLPKDDFWRLYNREFKKLTKEDKNKEEGK